MYVPRHKNTLVGVDWTCALMTDWIILCPKFYSRKKYIYVSVDLTFANVLKCTPKVTLMCTRRIVIESYILSYVLNVQNQLC